MKFLEKIKQGFVYASAPMEEVSDTAFRKLCYNHGADITFTEMARVDGLAKNNASALSKIKLQDDTPTIIQILVNKEQALEKFLAKFKPEPGFEGFNLNLGCPSDDVVSLGQGCAMMKRATKINKFIEIIRKHGYSVSIKMRLGLNYFEKKKKVYLNVLNNTNPDFFVIHARHGRQKYLEKADFSIYKECVDTGKIIIANGDIKNKEQIDLLKKLGIRGAMIGRAAASNPGIFDELKGKPSDLQRIRDEYLSFAKKYNSKDKYVENVIRRIGGLQNIDNDRLI